jgi:hypothetical protein
MGKSRAGYICVGIVFVGPGGFNLLRILRVHSSPLLVVLSLFRSTWRDGSCDHIGLFIIISIIIARNRFSFHDVCRIQRPTTTSAATARTSWAQTPLSSGGTDASFTGSSAHVVIVFLELNLGFFECGGGIFPSSLVK